ncbi:serine/threonine-protein kinase [Chondromyces crocatus]|uniref:Protein kinase n=1 Tax=Chondromyces crocatus TaxID=52 RepID=A0A0K1EU97_CHOCO|nr:serine/threonine-protein kinase [Chondromyces crocatus]AKT44203.1 protein kinase [Chondromyces crocatus]
MSEHVPRQPSQPPIEPGTLLVGKYRVERVIGRGGMGVVVEARHLALDERVALKFLLAEHALNAESSARFLREARASVKIKSEHVARVSDVGTLDDGAPYMVMEFLVGEDLAQLLQRQGPLSCEDAVDYVIQGCEAIAEAHAQGIIHRDLKPSNLFLTRRSDGSPLVKVLDFGISKVLNDRVDNLTSTTAAMGSALYMSPEQMQQTRSVDHRTDIYALGVALFELCAGRPPFYATTLPQLCAEVLTGIPTALRDLRPDLPEVFAAALAKAYARHREQRYGSVSEMVLAFAPFAPPRSLPHVERLARMGGLSAPGAPPVYRPPSPSYPTGSSYPVASHPTGPSYPAASYPAGSTPVPSPSGPGMQQPVPAISSPVYRPTSPSQPSYPAPRREPSSPSLESTHPLTPGARAVAVNASPGNASPGYPAAMARGAEGAADAQGGVPILPGPYAGPASARATASFATGSGTGSMVSPVVPPRVSRGVVVGMVAGALVSLAVVVGFVIPRLQAGPAETPGAASTEAQPEPFSSAMAGTEPQVPVVSPSGDSTSPAHPETSGSAPSGETAGAMAGSAASAVSSAPAAPPSTTTKASAGNGASRPVQPKVTAHPAQSGKPPRPVNLDDYK